MSAFVAKKGGRPTNDQAKWQVQGKAKGESRKVLPTGKRRLSASFAIMNGHFAKDL